MKSYEVTEWCPHCESEITMTWDVASMGYKAFCPVCGEHTNITSDTIITAEEGIVND